MFKHWLFRLRFRFGLWRYRKNPRSSLVLYLLQLVEVEFIDQYRPLHGLGIRIDVHYRNIDRLVNHLIEAIDHMRNGRFLERSLKENNEITITLDDYLTDNDDRPVTLAAALNALRGQYAFFVEAIDQKEDKPQRYYRRQFQHLESDVVEFIEVLNLITK